MTRNDFFNFSKLEKNIKKTNKLDDKQLLQFSKVICFKFDKEYETKMFVKHSIDGNFKSTELSKRGHNNCSLSIDSLLTIRYENDLELNKEKLKNLKSLMDYVPPIHQHFYNNLINFSDVERNDTITEHDVEDID